ncbi:MAG: hypothetical protein A3D24_00940 [Candidatus Blackburnbacteria bacterium RIFCSPHIGHO2_02_FULL_39_13]|nr:MAG: hypothetical protein A3D24_00940 [Candidatus Blackburnbacteria bacterium RIFCSPHIGHO2_02_FULL_39_13]
MRKFGFVYLRDLTIALSVKELKSKYKSATLGFLWVLLNPLLQMLALSLVFTFFVKIEINNYPVFVFSGLLPWTFFALSLQTGTTSLINNREIIKKTYFPRELLPISSVLAHLFAFIPAILLLLVFVLVTQGLSFSIFLLIPLIILQTLLLISLSLFLSSLDIYYRDVSYLLQALLVIWFYITPVFYSISFVPQKYLGFYIINPMVGIISSYQSIFLNTPLPSLTAVAVSVVETLLFAVIGVFVFRKRSAYFADWI